MPIRKLHLTRAEQDEYFQNAQKLFSQGVVIELPERRHSKSTCFEFQISPDSRLYVLAGGVPLYAVYVRIKSWRTNLRIEEFEIAPAWQDDIVSCVSEKNSYRFRGGLDFERKQVLNERIESSLGFRQRGQRVEGWLLATGLRPVPPEYGPRRRAPFELHFFDQQDNSYTCAGAAEVCRFRRDFARTRVGSLYGKTDQPVEAAKESLDTFLLADDRSINETGETHRSGDRQPQ
jgi:hypothetical protein